MLPPDSHDARLLAHFPELILITLFFIQRKKSCPDMAELQTNSFYVVTKFSFIPKCLSWLPLVAILHSEGFWTCRLTPSKLHSQDF